MQNSNLQLDAGSGTSEFTKTQLNLRMKRKISNYAIHITASDECLMQSRLQDSVPSVTPSSREQECSEMRKIGNCTWSHQDRKSAKSKRSNIRGKNHRMDLARGRKSKDISLKGLARR